VRPILTWADVAVIVTAFIMLTGWVEAHATLRCEREAAAHLRAELARATWLLSVADRRTDEMSGVRRLDPSPRFYDYEKEL
jgi:uncharacterized protein YdaU (DUF1376 family)